MSTRFLLLTPFVSFLIGCVGDSPTDPEPVPSTVIVSPSTLAFLSLGSSQQLTATVKDQNGATMASATVTWESSDTGVGTVSSSGLVTAVADGSASIIARAGSASGSVSLNVSQAIATLDIPSGIVMTNDPTSGLAQVEALDANGNEVRRPVTFSASVQSEARWLEDEPVIDLTGIAGGALTGLAPGRVVLLVQAEGVSSGPTEISVTRAEPLVFSFEIPGPTLSHGDVLRLVGYFPDPVDWAQVDLSPISLQPTVSDSAGASFIAQFPSGCVPPVGAAALGAPVSLDLAVGTVPLDWPNAFYLDVGEVVSVAEPGCIQLPSGDSLRFALVFADPTPMERARTEAEPWGGFPESTQRFSITVNPGPEPGAADGGGPPVRTAQPTWEGRLVREPAFVPPDSPMTVAVGGEHEVRIISNSGVETATARVMDIVGPFVLLVPTAELVSVGDRWNEARAALAQHAEHTVPLFGDILESGVPQHPSGVGPIQVVFRSDDPVFNVPFDIYGGEAWVQIRAGADQLTLEGQLSHELTHVWQFHFRDQEELRSGESVWGEQWGIEGGAHLLQSIMKCPLGYCDGPGSMPPQMIDQPQVRGCWLSDQPLHFVGDCWHLRINEINNGYHESRWLLSHWTRELMEDQGMTLVEAASVVSRGVMGGWHGFGIPGTPSYGPAEYGLQSALDHGFGREYSLTQSVLDAVLFHTDEPDRPGWLNESFLSPAAVLNLSESPGSQVLTTTEYGPSFVGFKVHQEGGAVRFESENPSVVFRLKRVR